MRRLLYSLYARLAVPLARALHPAAWTPQTGLRSGAGPGVPSGVMSLEGIG